MKKSILFLLLLGSVVANGQSVKDALFGGKLKNDNGTVVRKGEDLTNRIDTTARKQTATDSLKTKIVADTLAKKSNLTADATIVQQAEADDKQTSVANTTEANTTVSAVKDNNIVWKDFVNSVTNTVNTEVMTSKKIKKGTYYVTVTYAIETDGQLSISNVLVTPENSFLQQQVKDRLSLDAPKMTPVLNSVGVPRKVSRNYSFTLTKD